MSQYSSTQHKIKKIQHLSKCPNIKHTYRSRTKKRLNAKTESTYAYRNNHDRVINLSC